MPVLEDDYVGDLRYEGCAQPALKALDRSGWSFIVSTFRRC
jgi:GntR family transcriptional regulator/MocR family aminotransferase